ncbi:hypothetical protein TRSC58_07587 [Trypanosoma rangeli SC58]|uniref:Secreted protein n=1 Tax=Trypanosoma rangeli SC58 TaxID=429131 RepID=A0A061IUY3_TRYRA|nr:hypothetical protein TRSC58_07587 [Trypanosoma rangeli SC58]
MDCSFSSSLFPFFFSLALCGHTCVEYFNAVDAMTGRRPLTEVCPANIYFAFVFHTQTPVGLHNMDERGHPFFFIILFLLLLVV